MTYVFSKQQLEAVLRRALRLGFAHGFMMGVGVAALVAIAGAWAAGYWS